MLSLLAKLYLGGVWLVDFEFHPACGREGNLPKPVCMVARELTSGQSIRMWQDELENYPAAPFPTDSSALFVAYYASAEFGCFLALGWAMPVNVLDLFVEFRCKTNGRLLPFGSGILGALAYHGLGSISAGEKDHMRDLILRGGSGYVWGEAEKTLTLNYCESDVTALVNLLPRMLDKIDHPRALLRGQYTKAVAHMEHVGTPIDTETLEQLRSNWNEIKSGLIAAIDRDFGVYEGTTFKLDRFKYYLAVRDIAWPCLASGQLDLKDDTFKSMTQIHPELNPLRELRSALSQMKLSELPVGEDGRNRCMLSMFRSKTGRNQPSNSKFIFGPSVWLRGLIKPRKGFGIVYVDWSQQEFGIAAALSGDRKMIEAYLSGDPYLSFAIQAGAAPPNATKQSHKAIRDQFKATVLAVQYGMQAESLALRIQQPVARARELLELHKRTYRRYWQWSEGILNEAVLGGRLWTVFGWELHTDDKLNGRSLCNFPMQANGAEMLRLACIRLTQMGIRVCAPIHDAILIEAPLDVLDEVIEKTQSIMREVSSIVLSGFELESDVKVIRYPDRYMDDRGVKMWNTVMNQLDEPAKCIGTQGV